MSYQAAIKKLRRELLITQSELAKMLGVSFESVNRWENGKCEPTMAVKRKLSSYFEKYGLEID